MRTSAPIRRFVWSIWSWFFAMSKYQSPMGLPDEQMRLVGIIAAHWEWVELILERALAEIMEHQFARVALLTNQVSFSDKCDLVLVYARVYETTDPTTWSLFTKAIVALRNGYSLRNQFVHAQWKRDRKTAQWGKASIRTKGGKLTISDELVDIKSLEQAAEQIWDAGNNFTLLCRAHGVLLASPNTPAPQRLPPETNPQK
jgi:hypothetical protein